jgi:hypothetical protein
MASSIQAENIGERDGLMIIALDESLEPLKDAFNRSLGRRRFMTLLSPT